MEVEVAVELETEVEAAQSRSARSRIQRVGWCGCASHVCEAVSGLAERAKILAESILQCRARGSG